MIVKCTCNIKLLAQQGCTCGAMRADRNAQRAAAHAKRTKIVEPYVFPGYKTASALRMPTLDDRAVQLHVSLRFQRDVQRITGWWLNNDFIHHYSSGSIGREAWAGGVALTCGSCVGSRHETTCWIFSHYQDARARWSTFTCKCTNTMHTNSCPRLLCPHCLAYPNSDGITFEARQHLEDCPTPTLGGY